MATYPNRFQRLYPEVYLFLIPYSLYSYFLPKKHAYGRCCPQIRSVCTELTEQPAKKLRPSAVGKVHQAVRDGDELILLYISQWPFCDSINLDGCNEKVRGFPIVHQRLLNAEESECVD